MDPDSETNPIMKPPKMGMVYLVGAGPGDPGLITLRGVECLKVADVVLYDYLVNPVIAEHAPDSAELICLGRHGRSRIWNQDEINSSLVELASSGKTVVRLKGGDPAVFARGGEEAVILNQKEIPFEIVPGITAALAAGSHLGIPITHRDKASAVALVTGHGKSGGSLDASLDYAALAKFPGTLVFYMGVTTASQWSAKLMENGLAKETPVAIVRRLSLPNQQAIYCRLDEVVDRLTPYSKFPPPVIVIVGAVAEQRDAMNWFQQRPLFGQAVIVTRPADQAMDLGNLLAEQGAEVIYQPAIEIYPPDHWQPVDEAIDRLDAFDWLVFASVNGVKYFFKRLFSLDRDVRALGNVRIATVGTATSDALREFSVLADVQPSEFRAESLFEEFKNQAAGSSYLLVRASRGRDVLAESLSAAGGKVTQIVAYDSRDSNFDNDQLKERIANGEIDWITITSSAIARSLVNSLGESLRQMRIASISPVTSSTLRELGFEPTVEAETFTMQGVASAITSSFP